MTEPHAHPATQDEHGTEHAHPEHHEHPSHHEHGEHAMPGRDQEHEQAEHAGHTVPGDHAGHAGHAGHSGHGDPAGHAGHSGHGDHVAMFRRLFWASLLLTIPTVVLSPSFADLLGYALPDSAVLAWLPPVLGTVLYVWGGRPFLTGAVDELRSRAPGMMLLVALGITTAFVASWGARLGVLPPDLEYWWELALLVSIMLLGHWLEMASLARTSSALDELAALLPDEAEVLDPDGSARTVAPAELSVGDRVLVRPGGRVPADGRVTEGAAAVDESMVTGESVPVTRGPGGTVVAGTVVTDRPVTLEVTEVGEGTALAGIQRLVAEAQSSSTRAQRLADRAAALLFWFALAAAALAFVVWSIAETPGFALVRAITVLVIACPHALGLAIPLVVAISTGRAARQGVLVADRRALEQMRTVDTVVFDKTGTLTVGEPALLEVALAAHDDGSVGPGPGAPGGGEDRLIALAAAAEAQSQHPLARAIVAAAEERGLQVPRATAHDAATAVGVSAEVDGATVRVGGPALLEQAGPEARRAAEDLPTAAWAEAGRTVLHVLVDGRVAGALALADEVRPAAREAVDALHTLGLRTAMLTGDAETVARTVADELGIDEVRARVRPEDKNARIRDLQQQGRTVAMVGDGVNDAPALAQADVGLAIGAGTDVAIASAGIVLASDDPRTVVSVVRLSRAAYRKMLQNLWWAAGYNVVAVPLAAGVLAPIGFVMPMAVGALLMGLSTIVVALNAQTLRGLRLGPEDAVAWARQEGAR
jgi:P-type Cu2+ transporter